MEIPHRNYYLLRFCHLDHRHQYLHRHYRYHRLYHPHHHRREESLHFHFSAEPKNNFNL